MAMVNIVAVVFQKRPTASTEVMVLAICGLSMMLASYLLVPLRLSEIPMARSDQNNE